MNNKTHCGRRRNIFKIFLISTVTFIIVGIYVSTAKVNLSVICRKCGCRGMLTQYRFLWWKDRPFLLSEHAVSIKTVYSEYLGECSQDEHNWVVVGGAIRGAFGEKRGYISGSGLLIWPIAPRDPNKLKCFLQEREKADPAFRKKLLDYFKEYSSKRAQSFKDSLRNEYNRM